jgi:hypothetical protein
MTYQADDQAYWRASAREWIRAARWWRENAAPGTTVDHVRCLKNARWARLMGTPY